MAAPVTALGMPAVSPTPFTPQSSILGALGNPVPGDPSFPREGKYLLGLGAHPGGQPPIQPPFVQQNAGNPQVMQILHAMHPEWFGGAALQRFGGGNGGGMGGMQGGGGSVGGGLGPQGGRAGF